MIRPPATYRNDARRSATHGEILSDGLSSSASALSRSFSADISLICSSTFAGFAPAPPVNLLNTPLRPSATAGIRAGTTSERIPVIYAPPESLYTTPADLFPVEWREPRLEPGPAITPLHIFKLH